jgi:hypothetical protein
MTALSTASGSRSRSNSGSAYSAEQVCPLGRWRSRCAAGRLATAPSDSPGGQATNHYSGEDAPRVLRIGQLSGAPDAQHARLLSDVIHLLLDQYGRDAGSVLVRAVVREELIQPCRRAAVPSLQCDHGRPGAHRRPRPVQHHADGTSEARLRPCRPSTSPLARQRVRQVVPSTSSCRPSTA